MEDQPVPQPIAPPQDELEVLQLKFTLVRDETQVTLDLVATDRLMSAISRLSEHIPEGAKVMFIYDGRSLDQFRTLRELGLATGTTIQVVYTIPQQAPQPAQPGVGAMFRGGFERLLEADVPREDVLRQRLIFLARTGYLTQEQLQIMYMNSELLTPPRGYTAPRAQNVRQVLVQIIKQFLAIEYDFQEPLQLQPEQIARLYPAQLNPEGMEQPLEGLSQISFCLMFLEAGVPQGLQNQFRLLDFAFINERTPCPTIPLRAMALEVAWNGNQNNAQNLQDMARQMDLLGPHEPVVPPNRVMSSFQKLLTLVMGVLLGLVFNVLVFPFSMHASMSLELRSGIILGLIGNVIFAMFIGIAGVI